MPDNDAPSGGSQGDQPQASFVQKNVQAQGALEDVEHVLVVMSGKGGVGKSTVAVNVAVELARQGKRVGLLDVDITNPNTPRMLGLEDFRFEGKPPFKPAEAHGVRVASTAFFISPEQAVIWRGPMKIKMMRELIGSVAWGALDVLVADLPPGTSDEALSTAQMIPNKSGALLVTTPQTVSVDDVRRNVGFARRVDMPILGIVENMAGFTCENCGHDHDIFGSGGAELISEESDVPVLGRIPIDPRIVRAGDEGAPLVVTDPDSPSASAFHDLEARVFEALEAD